MGNFIQQKMRVQLGTECHMSLRSFIAALQDSFV